jgi:cytochrome d ubiquinol oxidase subunit II
MLGLGVYRPERIVINDELCEVLDSSDEWIQTLSGIRTRRYAGEDESLLDMAAIAAERALKAAGIAVAELGTVIFVLGVCVGAVATGRVRADAAGNVASAWLSPTAIVTGILFVSSCAYIGAVYLVGDSHRRGDEQMVRYFSRRALASGILTGALAATNLVLLHLNAAYVFHRLLHVAWPLLALSVAAGAAALVLIVLRRAWLLRVSAAMAVTAVVAAWGLAQYPYLLPGSLTLSEGSAPTGSLNAELVVMVMAAALVVPSFVYLYWLQQQGRLSVTESSDELKRAVVAETSTLDAPPVPRRYPVVTAVVVGAATLELARETITWTRRRLRPDHR